MRGGRGPFPLRDLSAATGEVAFPFLLPTRMGGRSDKHRLGSAQSGSGQTPKRWEPHASAPAPGSPRPEGEHPAGSAG